MWSYPLALIKLKLKLALYFYCSFTYGCTMQYCMLPYLWYQICICEWIWENHRSSHNSTFIINCYIERVLFCSILYFFTGSDQLKCFTEVCKCFTENQYEGSWLTQLYNVGESLACLIYYLPENTGFHDFFEKCQTVAGVLKNKYHLISDIVSLLRSITLL